jgi:hypothetical protein
MRFPDYESYESVSSQPLDGYLAYIGKRNVMDPYASYAPHTKQHAAALLAQGCTQLMVERNPRRAKNTFLDARKVLAAAEGVEGADNEQTLGLGGLIHAAAFRNQPRTIAKARESLHIEVMKGLGEALRMVNRPEVLTSSRRGLPKAYRGKVNQLTTLGLFTRYGAHPWIGAWQALDYYREAQASPKNVGIIVVEGGSSMESSVTYGLRVKSTCLGFCGREIHFDDPRPDYDKDIILVSGECDLGSRPNGRWDSYPVAQLLRKEYEETITSEELTYLNQVGSDLLQAVTGDNMDRRGTFSSAA